MISNAGGIEVEYIRPFIHLVTCKVKTSTSVRSASDKAAWHASAS